MGKYKGERYKWVTERPHALWEVRKASHEIKENVLTMKEAYDLACSMVRLIKRYYNDDEIREEGNRNLGAIYGAAPELVEAAEKDTGSLWVIDAYHSRGAWAYRRIEHLFFTNRAKHNRLKDKILYTWDEIPF